MNSDRPIKIRLGGAHDDGNGEAQRESENDAVTHRVCGLTRSALTMTSRDNERPIVTAPDAFLHASVRGSQGHDLLVARVDPRKPPMKGEDVSLAPTTADMHWFDTATGSRISA